MTIAIMIPVVSMIRMLNSKPTKYYFRISLTDRIRALADELGIKLDALEKKIKEWFMTDKLLVWLHANPKVVDFIRKVVLGLFEEWGIARKYSAGTHPIWVILYHIYILIFQIDRLLFRVTSPRSNENADFVTTRT